jgi:negative regulator of sigma E activity
MKPLEEELKAALKRQEAPAGFAGRVMARIAAEPARPRTWLASLFRYPRLRWAATAALAAVVLTGVWEVRRHEDRMKAEAARRQVMFALHFAGGKLNLAMRQASDIERRNSGFGGADKSH